MGAAASIPSAFQDEARQMVEVLRTSDDSNKRIETIKKFYEWTKTDSYRIPLCHPSLGFVEQLVRLLRINPKEQEMRDILNCFIYLSLERRNCALLGSRELGAGKEIVNLFPNESAYKFFANVLLVNETHSYLMSAEVGLMNHFVSTTRDFRTIDEAEKGFMRMKCMANISQNLREENLDLFLSYHPEVVVCEKLKTIVTKENANTTNFGLWCLNTLMGMSHFPAAVPPIKAQDGATIIKSRQIPNTRNGLKCAIAVANLTGRDEGSTTKESFIHSSPELFDLLLLVFHATLTKGEHHTAKKLKDMGFSIGTTTLRIIAGVFRTLAISDTNKPPILKSNALELLVETLYLFTSNAPNILVMASDGVLSNDAGGGGNDGDTAALCIEALLQLSFNYETNDMLTEKFLRSVPGFDLISILTECLADPRGKLLSEAKRNASSLLNRLRPSEKDVEVRSAAPASGTPAAASSPSVRSDHKHVMLSYSWAVNKALVIAFGQRLRELGHDVWRDEEGSSILGPMSGDTDEMMAAAIEASHTVVIFVSPQYKESANCRIEAKYAKQRQLARPNLKIVYVMMCENYHTRSNPPVDGWLALNIGTDLWYPLWHGSMVNSTAQSIADLVGKGSSSAAITAVPMKPLVEPHSPVNTGGSLSSPTSDGGVNWSAAWSIVNDSHCSTNPEAMKTLLSDLGVDDQSDFETVAKVELQHIGELLKHAKRNKFNAALCL